MYRRIFLKHGNNNLEWFSCRWCEATFLYQKSGPQFWDGEHVWGKFTFYEDNDISSKCTDWNRWERALDTAQKGVSLAQSVKSLGGY